MIRSWHLENFKSIRDMQNLNVGRLTIISGANSSGKSTLIQSIQLMMQTLANRENIPLQLNGELVTLGQVEDVWHNGQLPTDDEPNLLCLEMTLRDLYDEDYSIFLRIEFLSVDSTQVWLLRGEYGIGRAERNPTNFAERLRVVWDNERDAHVVEYISEALRDRITEELYERGLSDILPFDNAPIRIEDFYPRSIEIEARTTSRGLNWETALSSPIDFPASEEDLNLPLPDEMWPVLSKSANKLNLSGLESSAVLGLGRRKRQIHTLGEYKNWFGKLPTAQAHKLRELLVQELPGIVVDVKQWHGVSFFEIIERTLMDIFTRKIRYLSANRIAPTMLFTPDVNATWSEVGTTGANVAPAIREYGLRRIEFWNPFSNQIEEAALTEALVTWLKFFELVERVEAEDRGKLGTLLRVYASGVEKELDLTSVGFGTSQVLPIVVQGLLTPANGIFIVEQPEVHLHPRVQSQLGDFFIALTRVGVQCLIETHSEHIINRVRLRIVEDESGEILNRVRIYFAEKMGSESRFIAVEANEYGAIRNWPQGFFDQVENENLLIAKIASKKRRASKKE